MYVEIDTTIGLEHGNFIIVHCFYAKYYLGKIKDYN